MPSASATSHSVDNKTPLNYYREHPEPGAYKWQRKSPLLPLFQRGKLFPPLKKGGEGGFERLFSSEYSIKFSLKNVQLQGRTQMGIFQRKQQGVYVQKCSGARKAVRFEMRQVLQHMGYFNNVAFS